jgi:hypothetical protein
MADDEELPKYRRPGFLAKQQALYARALVARRLIQRNGASDGPIAPIAPLRAVRAIDIVRSRFEANDLGET